MIKDNTPIIFGVGQTLQRIDSDEKNLLSAYDLAAKAAQHAIDNSESAKDIAPHIDALTCIRLFEDSTRKIAIVSNPLGASNNVPGSVAKRLGIKPTTSIYAAVGGQTPQRLINEFCERIYSGENRCALITGAEAIATIKHAVRHGLQLDWNEHIDGDFEDRWKKNNADNMVSDYEMAHGLFLPVQAYPLFENFYRRRLGNSCAQHREFMAKLFAPFSQVAAQNPYAQFRRALSEEFLATPSDDNYLLSEPYTKWFVAQDAVNQGAAVLLGSVGLARDLGIPEHKWVFLHGYADVDDLNVVERPDLSVSHAQQLVCEQALESAGKKIDEIEFVDLYSCFPIAVTSACSALGIEPFSRALTLTGGLPYFGGPGNNYSMHAIAEVVERVRGNPGSYGMVVANGGYLSKHSAGVYSATAHKRWRPIDNKAIQHSMDNAPKITVAETGSGQAEIETYVAAYNRGIPTVGYVFARVPVSSERLIAKVCENDKTTLNELFNSEPVGRHISVTNENGINYFTFNS
ncbi:MAG: acetyl-CoA acetyltransferase [Gammaproteobacteria bacterium]